MGRAGIGYDLDSHACYLHTIGLSYPISPRAPICVQAQMRAVVVLLPAARANGGGIDGQRLARTKGWFSRLSSWTSWISLL